MDLNKNLLEIVKKDLIIIIALNLGIIYQIFY
jgi:hypothetical protein